MCACCSCIPFAHEILLARTYMVGYLGQRREFFLNRLQQWILDPTQLAPLPATYWPLPRHQNQQNQQQCGWGLVSHPTWSCR